VKNTGILILFMILAVAANAAEPSSYTVEKLSDGLYAALARPASAATSNAFFFVGKQEVIAGGAHMTERATRDLLAEIGAVTDKPLRYFILPHHHPGYTSVDFYLPKSVDVIMTYPVWQQLQREVLPFPNQTLLYSEGLTFKFDGKSIILTNMDKAHAEGDALVYFPEEKTVFTSDIVYVNSVGFMGEGHMEDWMLALEFLGQLPLEKVIPGHGPVSRKEAIAAFKTYFKTFLSEVIKHIEAGDSLEKTKKEFNLPQYSQYQGYNQLLELNIDRAYRNLRETVLAR